MTEERKQYESYRNNEALVQPKEMKKLDGIATHLEEMLKGMQEFRTRLGAVADRMLGAVPEPVDTSGSGSTGGGMVACYQGIVDGYADQLRKLCAIVERLEKL